ncbi:class I SAM-dependent methyltransferase [Kibdelosporangium phytohabitans]|uniref:class I SAM-dependent methyltransferase n=1 Tax=Kibdelosporangium phytohabitans TaxID=860235 RepID=UPI0009F82195
MAESAVEPLDVSETRTAYDTVAASYEVSLRDALAANPWDRAVLDIFADLVGSAAPVADLGCGPGRITGYLAGLGLEVFGVDLSPAMVEVAQRVHPRLRFEVGSMSALTLADASLAGVVAWYSIIHTPPTTESSVPGNSAATTRATDGRHSITAIAVLTGSAAKSTPTVRISPHHARQDVPRSLNIRCRYSGRKPMCWRGCVDAIRANTVSLAVPPSTAGQAAGHTVMRRVPPGGHAPRPCFAAHARPAWPIRSRRRRSRLR